MESPKVFFHSNIKFLRERRHMTQENEAQSLGFERNKLQALESGRTKNPAADDLIKFSEFFRVSVDSLLKIDLSKLGELKVRQLLAGNDVYTTGSNLRVLAITVDSKNREHMEYVPVKAKAGYQAGHTDPEYIASLPKVVLPNIPRNGTFRMFPIKGDSMLPLPEDSEVIGQFVQDWSSLKPNTPCIVILRGEQDFVFKLVTLQAGNTLLLRSQNPSYAVYSVQTEDVLEIWKYYKHQTSTIPAAPTDLEEIKGMIHDLSIRINNRK